MIKPTDYPKHDSTQFPSFDANVAAYELKPTRIKLALITFLSLAFFLFLMKLIATRMVSENVHWIVTTLALITLIPTEVVLLLLVAMYIHMMFLPYMIKVQRGTLYLYCPKLSGIKKQKFREGDNLRAEDGIYRMPFTINVRFKRILNENGSPITAWLNLAVKGNLAEFLKQHWPETLTKEADRV